MALDHALAAVIGVCDLNRNRCDATAEVTRWTRTLDKAKVAPYRNIPTAQLRPAPVLGEHTRELCQQLLGLDDAEIDRLVNAGVLFTHEKAC